MSDTCAGCAALDADHLRCRVDGAAIGPESEACRAHHTRLEIVRGAARVNLDDASDEQGGETRA